MTSPRNSPTPITGEQWMRRVEKEVGHEQRRPKVSKASDLLGPGFAPHAVEIRDWNTEAARFNGFFYSQAEALNIPEAGVKFLGIVVGSRDGHAVQMVWSHGAMDPSPERVYVRSMHTHVNAVPVFTPWRLVTGGTGGGTGAVVLDDLADVALPVDMPLAKRALVWDPGTASWKPDTYQAALPLGDGASYLAGDHTLKPFSHTHPMSQLTAGALGVPLQMVHQATLATPSTGRTTLGFKTDGRAYVKNSFGEERPLVPEPPVNSVHSNPSFEEWATSLNHAPELCPVGWSDFWSATNSTMEASNDRVDGNYAVKVTVPGPGPARLIASATVTVLPGSVVTAGVWARGTGSNPRVGLDVVTAASPTTPDFFVSGTIVQGRSFALTSEWRYFETDFIVPSTHDRMRLSPYATSSGGTAEVWFDATSTTVRQTESRVLTGTIIEWPSTTAPAGYLRCNGGAHNIADYPVLATLLGTTFGGNGTTTFAVPSLSTGNANTIKAIKT